MSVELKYFDRLNDCFAFDQVALKSLDAYLYAASVLTPTMNEPHGD